MGEFLALPETEPPCEFYDGETRQKVSANIPHSALAAAFAASLRQWARDNEPCLVGVEGRHITPDRTRAYLPDVHATRMSCLAGHERESPMSVAPDVIVEILSPDDRPSHVLDKLEMYAELGIPAVLLVDPDDRTVREYRPGAPAVAHHEGDRLDLSSVLPGFTLACADLFAVLPGQPG